MNQRTEEWPLQRLISMLNQMQNKEKEEWKLTPLTNTKNEKEIGPLERDEAVAWILELTHFFSFQPETFFLASSILDRFITSVKAQPKYLKCIAVSCFYLASKICEEENVVPCTGELVKDSKCGCRPCDVLQMERIILVKLSWSIQSSTALDYLHIFHAMSFVHFTDLSLKLSLSRYLTSLTNVLVQATCSYQVSCFPNAAISLALVSLHLRSILPDPEEWTCISAQLQALAKVKTRDFMLCREKLMSFMPQDVAPPIQRKLATFKKVLNLETGDSAKPEVVLDGSVAIKRKASKPSPTSVDGCPKKLHSSAELDQSSPMEIAECGDDVDSDATMTASENEDNMHDEEVLPDGTSRRLTYAEIVKCGLNAPELNSCGGDLSNMNPSSDAYTYSLCALEASRTFLPSTVTTCNSVTGIPT